MRNAEEYDGRVINIKGLSSKIPSVPFDIGEFGIHKEKIREASEIAMALDDYQVLMCRMSKGLGNEDPRWRKYFDLRASTIQTLTELRVNLSALKKSPDNQTSLSEMVERLKSLDSVDKEIIPQKKKEELEKKDEITKSDIPEVNDDLVNNAKMAARVDETHLENLAKNLAGQKDRQPESDVTLEVKRVIYNIKETVAESQIEGLPLQEIYEKVAPLIRQLYLKPDFKKFIGTNMSNELKTLLSALQTLIWQYTQARQQHIAEDIQKYSTWSIEQFESVMIAIYTAEARIQ